MSKISDRFNTERPGTNSGDNTCTTVPTQEWTCSLDPNLVLLAGKVTHKHHSDRLGFMPRKLKSTLKRESNSA
jgi:hypothetical protein